MQLAVSSLPFAPLNTIALASSFDVLSYSCSQLTDPLPSHQHRGLERRFGTYFIGHCWSLLYISKKEKKERNAFYERLLWFLHQKLYGKLKRWIFPFSCLIPFSLISNHSQTTFIVLVYCCISSQASVTMSIRFVLFCFLFFNGLSFKNLSRKGIWYYTINGNQDHLPQIKGNGKNEKSGNQTAC